MDCCSTTLTDEERAQYQANLTAATQAYHNVMVGGAVREFHDQNGERIVYSSGNRAQLLGYINWLRLTLGLCPLGGFVAPPAGVFL